MPDALISQSSAALPLTAIDAAGEAAALAAMPAGQVAFLRSSGFSARRPGSLALLPGPDGLVGALLGLGEAAATPWTYGALPMALPEGTDWRLEGAYDPAAAALGWALGAYRFRRYRSRGGDRVPARLVLPEGAGTAPDMAAAICRGRDLINTPAADLGPAELADAVRRLGQAHGAEVEIVERAELDVQFPCIAAVGRGAAANRQPKVAILRWTGPDAAGAPLLALCGKGVCFDTGGLDLKPSAGMLRMKKDMGGAATVLALAEALMRTGAKLRLLVLVGAVENVVSATTFRPMDVLPTRSGMTVEIGNTDAEGRLVLADLLTYATEQSPDLVVDCATLTGAARVALGPDLPALFCNNEALAAGLLASSTGSHDPLWRLPLHPGYDSWLDSNVADFNNVSTKPMAGSIIAGLFLQRFVPDGTRWAHLDLYAWNDSTRPGRPEGGEIQAMRGLHDGIVQFLAGLT